MSQGRPDGGSAPGAGGSWGAALGEAGTASGPKLPGIQARAAGSILPKGLRRVRIHPADLLLPLGPQGPPTGWGKEAGKTVLVEAACALRTRSLVQGDRGARADPERL